MKACQCPSDNFLCHVADGCVCRQGFTGANCEDRKTDTRIGVEQSSSGGGVAIGVVIVLILLGAIIAVVFYYKRRVSNLKTEIAHVQYIADPSSQPDRHHFDNPVYSYQGGVSRSEDSNNLLNNMLKNNLSAKQNNTDFEKLRMVGAAGSSGDSDELYDHTMALKNRDADKTNPNVYHSIDDEKVVDHVYDEIKHKEGYEMEYDHLNYTRPATSWRPHYQKMPNGFLQPKLDNDRQRPPSPTGSTISNASTKKL